MEYVRKCSQCCLQNQTTEMPNVYTTSAFAGSGTGGGAAFGRVCDAAAGACAPRAGKICCDGVAALTRPLSTHACCHTFVGRGASAARTQCGRARLCCTRAAATRWLSVTTFCSSSRHSAYAASAVSLAGSSVWPSPLRAALARCWLRSASMASARSACHWSSFASSPGGRRPSAIARRHSWSIIVSRRKASAQLCPGVTLAHALRTSCQKATAAGQSKRTCSRSMALLQAEHVRRRGVQLAPHS